MIKKAVFCFMVFLLLAGCSAAECPECSECPDSPALTYGGYSYETCEANWKAGMSAGEIEQDGRRDLVVRDFILSEDQIPGTRGGIIKDCINGGWWSERFEVLELVREAITLDVIGEVEVIKTVEVDNSQDVSDTITLSGQYLVPEQMQPGQWSYKSNVEDGACWVITYKDLSGTSESKIDNFYSENQGFFRLNENVRMVEIASFSDCVFSRIGD